MNLIFLEAPEETTVLIETTSVPVVTTVAETYIGKAIPLVILLNLYNLII